jgi:hypothetical protein
MAWMMAGNTLLATTHPTTSTNETQHTSRRGVLAGKVPGLVAAEKTSGLGLRGRAPGELLVKVDDALHPEGIGGGTNSLCGPNCQPVSCRVVMSRPPGHSRSSARFAWCCRRRRRFADQSLTPSTPKHHNSSFPVSFPPNQLLRRTLGEATCDQSQQSSVVVRFRAQPL